jgi:hypothetical protein
MSLASGNLEPKDKTDACDQLSQTGCLHHYCSLCKQLSDPLQKVRDALQSSVAQALKDARKSVQDQLQGSALTSLEKSFDDAAQPLTGMTSLIHSSLGGFIEEDSIEKLSDPMNTHGALASVFLILCGLLIAACGGTSITAWMCLEKRKSDKLRKLTHRCACCTWNSGCIYILFAFFIGGILMIVTMIMSSVCLFMEDMVLTPSVLDDMSRAMGVELSSGPQMTMLQDILGQCFKPNNPTNPMLLKILKVENSTGAEITMHQMIVGNTKDQINAQFDKIGTGSSIPKLAQNADIKKLTDLLRDNSVSNLMIPKWLDPDNTAYTANTPTGTPIQLTIACQGIQS